MHNYVESLCDRFIHKGDVKITSTIARHSGPARERENEVCV